MKIVVQIFLVLSFCVALYGLVLSVQIERSCKKYGFPYPKDFSKGNKIMTLGAVLSATWLVLLEYI